MAELLYGVEGRVPDEEYLIPIGKADIKREGKDVTIIATGIMVHEALGAAEKLEKEGIEAEILDPRTLLPVNRNAILKSVEKTGRVVITHRATKTGGIGAEFAAIIAEEAWGKLKVPDQESNRARYCVAMESSTKTILLAKRRQRGQGSKGSHGVQIGIQNFNVCPE